MTPRRHLTFLLDGPEVAAIAEQRHRWDPVMARSVPPHVTLVYPEEVTDEFVVLERASDLAATIDPFSMACGSVVGDDEGVRGVFVTVHAASGTWDEMRRVLVGGDVGIDDGVGVAGPHITIVHPRTSDRGPEALRELAGWRPEAVVVARELALTTTSVEHGMEIVERFPLRGTTRRLVVAVALHRDGEFLLGKRCRDRSWYPGVWDLPGGHLEPGESPAAAAVREAREEAGVVIDSGDLRHVDTVIGDDYELIAFSTEVWRGTPINTAPDEHDELTWFGVGAIGALELADPVIEHIVDRCVA